MHPADRDVARDICLRTDGAVVEFDRKSDALDRAKNFARALFAMNVSREYVDRRVRAAFHRTALSPRQIYGAVEAARAIYLRERKRASRVTAVVALLFACSLAHAVPPWPDPCVADSSTGSTLVQCGFSWPQSEGTTYYEIRTTTGCVAGRRYQRAGKGKLNPPDNWWHPYRGKCEPLPGETIWYVTVACNDCCCSDPNPPIDMVGQDPAHIESTPDGHGCERGTSLMPWLRRCP